MPALKFPQLKRLFREVDDGKQEYNYAKNKTKLVRSHWCRLSYGDFSDWSRIYDTNGEVYE